MRFQRCKRWRGSFARSPTLSALEFFFCFHPGVEYNPGEPINDAFSTLQALARVGRALANAFSVSTPSFAFTQG